MPPDSARSGGAAAARRGPILTLAVAGGVVFVVVVATLLSGARFSWATLGLLAAAAALLMCLQALYGIASALMRPSVETALEHEGVLGQASQRQLREEKRRLVRAINELTFDHEMGKLSKADYDSVRELYELQAIEVMRALQDDRDLHPALAEALRRLDAPADPSAEPAAARTDTPAPSAAAKGSRSDGPAPSDDAPAREEAEA